MIQDGHGYFLAMAAIEWLYGIRSPALDGSCVSTTAKREKHWDQVSKFGINFLDFPYLIRWDGFTEVPRWRYLIKISVFHNLVNYLL